MGSGLAKTINPSSPLRNLSITYNEDTANHG